MNCSAGIGKGQACAGLPRSGFDATSNSYTTAINGIHGLTFMPVPLEQRTRDSSIPKPELRQSYGVREVTEQIDFFKGRELDATPRSYFALLGAIASRDRRRVRCPSLRKGRRL